MAVKTLALLRDVVEADLVDSSNAIWTTAEIDRAIRRALFRYSEVRPQQAVTTITAAASREYTLSVTGLTGVSRVWWPYDSTDPEYPPQWVDFELWDDNTILYLKSSQCPAVGDDPIRLFYTKLHTLNGLDSETTSTYFVEDEECLALGSCAFAAEQRARYTVDTVNPTVNTPGDWRKYSIDRMRAFEAELTRIASRMLSYSDARVVMEFEV